MLSAQMATSNAQRVELQSRWTEHERLMSLDLASAKVRFMPPVCGCWFSHLLTQLWLLCSESFCIFWCLFLQAEISRLENDLKAAEREVS